MSSQQPAVPAAASTPVSPGLWRSLYERFRYVAAAAFGSVVVGVTIPVLLVCWNNSKQLAPGAPAAQQLAENLTEVAFLEMIATLFCGPGAMILSILLFLYLSRRKDTADVHQLVKRSMLIGGAASFLNFPGLMASELMGGKGVFTELRVITLFLIAGATCGAWIGWQVYRQAHPGTSFFPRYRLSTLLALVIAWAILLAIFAPSSIPPSPQYN